MLCTQAGDFGYNDCAVSLNLDFVFLKNDDYETFCLLE